MNKKKQTWASSTGNRQLRNMEQADPYSEDTISCPIYMFDSDNSVLKLDLTSCTKMFDIVAPVKEFNQQDNWLALRWSKPNCTECEAKGKRCKWKNNNTGDIECFDCKGKQNGIQIPRSLIFAATGETRLFHTTLLILFISQALFFNHLSPTVFVCSILLGLVVIAIFKIIHYFRRKEEDQARVDKF